MALFVDIKKRLGSFTLDVKFEAQNEILSLLGASGCGKTLTLKCIAGIETPDSGRIVLDGVTLFDSEKKINLPPQKRNVGYLFQQYALFPNMTVWQNIACGVRSSKKDPSIIEHMIHTMHLEGCEQKKPHQLSGGQQQRTALARILVNEPALLLLDEPFSALDSHLRFQLEQEVRQAIREFQKTVILVSHNRDEVYRLSDQVAIMGTGYFEAIGSNKEIFRNPKTKNGAILTGCKNVSPFVPMNDGRIFASDWQLPLKIQKDIGGASYVGIRMHSILYNSTENTFLCQVEEEIENPFSFTIMLRPVNCPSARCIGWEIEKDVWRQIRAPQIPISLPQDAILLLKGETSC